MKGSTAVALCLVSSLSVAAAASVMAPTVQSGMTVSVLRVASAAGQPSQILVGSDRTQYSVGVDSSGNFIIASNTSPLLVVSPDDDMTVTARNFSASSLDLRGDLQVNGVKQFRIAAREDLSSGEATGWDNPASEDIVSKCAGITMLGGFGKFARGEVTKNFGKLPPHTELRVKATFHFIDAWAGETAFMRLSIGEHGKLTHVWAERHSQDMEQEAVNVCGGAVGEGKFAVPIDVSVSHSSDNVTVGFGTTMQEDDPFDQSWGVSYTSCSHLATPTGCTILRSPGLRYMFDR
ncbi:hypothetical protein BESB_045350 [Besnoitia besnoiti]|uniref:Uncharacterized protein n=1 Tax=Besnoitia besnoiti TaxID=94643 RepID=A0A2A9MKY6_BESBE|nr:hypothetical protein BESB_045350 [Besnoitia besnoiti]PFH36343.1 hypothetical protein BESB_045350 [Besnoitia besnoiti]